MTTPLRTTAALAGAALAITLIAAPAARAQALDRFADAAPVANASGDGIAYFVDAVAHLFLIGAFVADAEQHRSPEMADRGYRDDWDGYGRRRQRDAREGFMFSFGLGGGTIRVSPTDQFGSTGAVQGNLRMGYGFSDRFQLFMDLTGAGGSYGRDVSTASWLFTIRGQTVLIGDRRGNGLNLNLGFGLGGNTRSQFGNDYDSPAGAAIAGGLSFDFRVTRSFALQPELFFWWHSIPNGPGQDSDYAKAAGLQLNFLWYGP